MPRPAQHRGPVEDDPTGVDSWSPLWHLQYDASTNFSTTVRDAPGEAYKLLATLANLGVSLLAFTAVPIGPLHTQLTIFPQDSAKLANEAQKDRLVLDGPHPALLVQGDDELGALDT